MRRFFAAALVATLAVGALPAAAGNNWGSGNSWHGDRRGGCWNCGRGGIGPGAAVALGLGSFALGGALAGGWWPGYYGPVYAAPPVPRQCWNSWAWAWYPC